MGSVPARRGCQSSPSYSAIGVEAVFSSAEPFGDSGVKEPSSCWKLVVATAGDPRMNAFQSQSMAIYSSPANI